MTSPPPPAAAPPPPLSPGRTALFGLLVLAVTGITQQLAMAALAAARGQPEAAAARADGLAYTIGILAGTITGGTTLALLVRRAPRATLALTRPRPSELVGWLLVEIAAIAAIDAGTRLLGKPAVPAEYVEALRSAGSLPLLALALCVAAPVFEELFFRGFLLGNLAASRLGTWGAITVVSLLFSAVHGPTDAWSAITVLFSALVLAAARVRTGSTIPGIAMHALGNAKVIVHVALVAGSSAAQ